ncbi:PREDICTED: ATP synthase-coupling factor 6, mitochondrial [Ceratosolen solmsi marchali]|uniref:ATP synthase-coupling factor 6, mitochondrial n=1 Tax=Ceratosolen solmsi marchali TaxID=326594 RepID=A0AAJ6YID2_9HYME|nr:PREDICTED: ATP synthase-coupling factor 6, mitochondrial [Ceratosolen solmsi marchali]XP_011498619.1 PREDICTED: ATP synthase-coupling factor 6, mitochondrial [Ceratosolen solmsi marchali]XP_011498620.1 PREDICTED: ATP synthase-coupling factor 6, mitochondrial [Ceratosolen solmsi marchali]
MLSRRIVEFIPKLWNRNFGVFAPVLQKAIDPIQQLFLDKIKEYKALSATGKMKIPDDQKELKSEVEKLVKQYGGSDGTDLSSFPKFNFPDPVIEVTPLQPSK